MSAQKCKSTNSLIINFFLDKSGVEPRLQLTMDPDGNTTPEMQRQWHWEGLLAAVTCLILQSFWCLSCGTDQILNQAQVQLGGGGQWNIYVDLMKNVFSQLIRPLRSVSCMDQFWLGFGLAMLNWAQQPCMIPLWSMYFLVTIDLNTSTQTTPKEFLSWCLCIATRVKNCWWSFCESHELGKHVSNTILQQRYIHDIDSKPQENNFIDDILWRIENQSQVTVYMIQIIQRHSQIDCSYCNILH